MATKSNTETGKIRNLAGATAFSMAVLSGSAYGLGLGSIELGSALNQPFNAEIEVLTDVPGEASDLAVQLASQEAFLRAGIDRPSSLNKLSFSLRKRDGRSYILVSSSDPIVEPFLNFLVEVDWKNGNLVREYTVLLDPPTFVAEQPSTTVASELAEVGDDVTNNPTLPMRIEREAAEESNFNSTSLTEEELAAELAAVNLALGESTRSTASSAKVKASDPLLDELREVDDLMVVGAGAAASAAEPAVAAAPAATSQALGEVSDNEIFGEIQTAAAPAEATVAPEPVQSDDGSYTETAVDDMAAVVAALDRELLGEGTAAAPKAAAKPAQAASASGKTLDPVRRGQTLWSIASANRVPGVSVEQMMVALLRANPNAFDDGNINALNRGAILRVPTSSEVADMDRQSALTSVSEQNALWKKYRDQARSEPVQAQQGESTAAAPAPAVEEAKPDGTLTLVADTDEAKTGDDETVEANTAISAESEAQMAELRNQLNLAQEEADTERQRADEMNSRVLDLESAVEKMNKLLELRNDELAKLQAAVGEGQGEADAEAARQLAEAQQQMADQLQAVKDEAQQAAETAETQRLAAEQEIQDLRAKLGDADEAAATAAAEAAAAAEAEAAAAVAAAAAEESAEPAEPVTMVEPVEVAEPMDAETEAQPWYQPYMTADNAKIAGGVAVAGLGLWALLGFGRRRKEEELFSEDNYVQPDDTAAVATNDYADRDVEEYDNTSADYDATAYGHTAIADELGDETIDATDLTALDSTMTDGMPDAGNVDVLQEADVYLSYGLADRAEELLDGAIENDPNDPMLQAKRLEALFVKQDGVSFETAALTYHDKFGGDDAPHWDKVASWGAALAPSANLFSGAEPANLDETQDITSLDTTKLAGGAAAAAATAGGLAASVGGLAGSLGDSASETLDDALDKAGDLKDKASDGLNLTSTELEDALDNTTDGLSSLGDDLSETAADSLDGLDGLGGDLSAELDGGDLGADLSTGLAGSLDDLDNTAASLSDDLGSDLGSLDDLDGTAVSLGDDLESMSAGLEDDLEMTALEATLAGDGELQDMLDATGADDFELSLADEGTGAGDGGLAGDLGLGDLESELLSTDATGSLGGLSEEIDFEAAGLSLSDETTDADMTVTGDEVDTMLDLARAYIDMGDADSATSTIKEIIATGNADQVSAAKELQSQLG